MLSALMFAWLSDELVCANTLFEKCKKWVRIIQVNQQKLESNELLMLDF